MGLGTSVCAVLSTAALVEPARRLPPISNSRRGWRWEGLAFTPVVLACATRHAQPVELSSLAEVDLILQQRVRARHLARIAMAAALRLASTRTLDPTLRDRAG
jgi:hypothetical protein